MQHKALTNSVWRYQDLEYFWTFGNVENLRYNVSTNYFIFEEAIRFSSTNYCNQLQRLGGKNQKNLKAEAILVPQKDSQDHGFLSNFFINFYYADLPYRYWTHLLL